MSDQSITRLREERAQQRYLHWMGRLNMELELGTPRRHLDPLVELLEELLARCGSNNLTLSFANELRKAKALVSTRHNLRLVRTKGAQ